MDYDFGRLGMPGSGHEAIRYLRSLHTARQNGTAVITRSAVGEVDVDAALRSSATFAGDDFLEALRAATVLDRLGGREVEFRTRLLSAGDGALGYWYGAGRALPVSRTAMTGHILLPKSVGALVVTTNQALMDPTAKTEARLSADLVAAAAAALDKVLLDPSVAGDEYTPTSITHGISPISSTGSTLAEIDADLKAMLEQLADAGSRFLDPKWIMRPQSAIYLSMLRGSGGALAYPNITASGGTLAGIPVLVSGNVVSDGSPSSTTITLVEADDFVFGQGPAEVSLSDRATIEMDTSPTGDTITPVAASQRPVSMFQANATALKASREANWEMRRPTISVLESVSY
jgi:capsid protein